MSAIAPKPPRDWTVEEIILVCVIALLVTCGISATLSKLTGVG